MYKIDHELLMKNIRKKGMSYVELADAAQISRTALYNVVVGKNNPSYYLAVNLINSLGLSLEDTAAIFYPHIEFKKTTRPKQFTY